jgi:ADP-ribose pyrophosphatase YjhB (NUDIX family)
MTIEKPKICPACGQTLREYKNPALTVDIIIESGAGQNTQFILVRRKNPPYGWAIPGGFVDYGEKVEDAAAREAKEETGLSITIRSLLGVYSDPGRDPRGHTVSVVYLASGDGDAKAGDDAAELAFFSADNLPESIVFDHNQIISDYLKVRHIAKA